MIRGTKVRRWLVVWVAAVSLGGCQTLRQMTALEAVDFSIQGLHRLTLAGVELDDVRSYQDLGPSDVLTIAAAIGQGTLPLSLRLDVAAENPASNVVAARMIQLDWTLLLEGRETVSGAVSDPVTIPPGEVRSVPVDASLDLLRFFQDSGPDLVELVLALAGQSEGEPKEIALRATPTVETAIGPITYPAPVTILRRRVGG